MEDTDVLAISFLTPMVYGICKSVPDACTDPSLLYGREGTCVNLIKIIAAMKKDESTPYPVWLDEKSAEFRAFLSKCECELSKLTIDKQSEEFKQIIDKLYEKLSGLIDTHLGQICGCGSNPFELCYTYLQYLERLTNECTLDKNTGLYYSFVMKILNVLSCVEKNYSSDYTKIMKNMPHLQQIIKNFSRGVRCDGCMVLLRNSEKE